MTLNRLQQLAETYGADLKRWPRRERAALEATLDQTPEARALLRDAARLDQLLDGWRLAPVDRSLGLRIVAATAGRPQQPASGPGQWLRSLAGALLPDGRSMLGERWWPQVAGLAAATIIGFFIGISDFGTLETASATDIDVAFSSLSSVGTWQ